MAAARSIADPVPHARHAARLGDACERVVAAGQALVASRIKLGGAEARDVAHSGLALVVATAVALIGWLYLVHGATDYFARSHPRFLVELAAGALHLGLAFGLLALARRPSFRAKDLA
jgi:hypothetical protein